MADRRDGRGYGMEYIDLEDVSVEATTDLAVLVRYEGDSFWIPRSVIEDADDLETGDDDVTIGVRKWFLEKEGIT